MRIFISAGEPSGDLHGANLIGALRKRVPNAEFIGFGGDKMSAAGCRLLFPLCKLSFMWLGQVFKNIRTFLGLVKQADHCFRDEKPDAVVLIDYPGFNWHLAKRAAQRGIPVIYFVPPQLWAWAGWRVRKMRKWVDCVLCSLPFEEEWYRQRGVEARYIGHPYFDELSTQRFDDSFLNEQRQRPERVVAILPGSRKQEVLANWPTLKRAAELISEQHPDVRFLVGAFNHAQREHIVQSLDGSRLPIEVHIERTPEIIHRATACLSVSGSVGLELLYGLVPSVIVYRITRYAMWLARRFMTVRWIGLVNLLADEELFPEFLTTRCEADAMARQVSRWLSDENARSELRSRLRALLAEVGQRGSCARAAEAILNRIGQQSPGVAA
jgi:lipid-A-disaccharide synthase